MADRIKSDIGGWAIVPKWLLKADVSAQAIRLYAVLGCYADNQTQKAYPGREKLARDAQCSVATVDRTLAELKKVGALKWEKRGRNITNLYTVIRTEPVTGEDQTERESSLVSPQESSLVSPELEPVELEPVSNGAARKSDRKPRERDLLFEALVSVCDASLDELTTSSRGPYNRVAKELRELGTDPEDVGKRGQAYRKKYPGMALTPTALLKHWPALGKAARNGNGAQEPPRSHWEEITDTEREEYARLAKEAGV